MKLLNMALQGFRSFGPLQSIDFEGMAPGLYHVTGRNLEEPALEGNGNGKSSFFESIGWCLFGSTSRGLKGGNVERWGGKERTLVATEWGKGTEIITVYRCRNPIELNVVFDRNDAEEHPHDQDQLEELIGWTPSLFHHAVHFAQFREAFSDLKPSDQLELFSSLLKLDVWERAATHTSAWVLKLRNEHTDVRERIAGLQGEARAMMESGIDERHAAWEAEYAQRVQQAHSAVKATIAEATPAAQAAIKAAADAAEFRRLRDESIALEPSIGALDKKVKQIERELAQLESKDYKNCPTCGAPVDNSHIAKERTAKAVELFNTGHALDQLIDKHDALLKAMGKHRDAEVRAIRAAETYARCQVKVEAAQAAVARVADERNPYADELSSMEQRADELVAAIDAADAELLEIEQALGAAEFWVRGFKEVRLSLVQESLAQFTLEANEMLFELGLRDWAIEFDIERDTKSGGVARGFTILVRSPHNKDAVPLAAWCGGETQRLRLAIAMGFCNLICSRAGTQPNIEMWDEPTRWLSGAGIQDLLGILAERARRYGKIILLADHRAFEFGGFAGRITIDKDKEGSKLLWAAA